MGISMKSWGREDGRRVLSELIARSIPVKVMVMDHEHPGLAAMINTSLPQEDLEAVRRQTSKMGDYFEEIARGSQTFEFRRLRIGVPHFQLIATEETALVLQYMFSRGTGDSPLQQFPGGSPLHRAFHDEFETLWRLNAPA